MMQDDFLTQVVIKGPTENCDTAAHTMVDTSPSLTAGRRQSLSCALADVLQTCPRIVEGKSVKDYSSSHITFFHLSINQVLKSRKKKLSLQKVSDLLQNLLSEISDALTDDFSDEEVLANNLLEFLLDSLDDDQETEQDSRCSCSY
ncbi:hypothetical protein TNCV_318111 [Trichonephila clavipes]|nr:hypothetical protein TNCV_318111 [Trichonephila clavipes]